MKKIGLDDSNSLLQNACLLGTARILKIVENGAKHPLGSTSLMYLPRKSGGRGLKSVESEYKLIKIKAAIKLYSNTDWSITD